MNYKTICIFLLLTFSIISGYIILKENNNEPRVHENICKNLRIKNIILEEGFFHTYDFENISVDLYSEIKDYKNDSSNLRELAKNKITLFLFIYSGSCNKCEVENINAVKRFQKEHNSNVVIGIAGLKDRRFKAFVTNHEIRDIAYHIPDGYFEGFNYNPIIYFLLTSELETKCFYAPNDIYTGLTQNYLSKIRGIYNF